MSIVHVLANFLLIDNFNLKVLIGAIPMCFTYLFKSKFSQNKTNLLSIINVATCFDSNIHHQVNH